MTDLGIASAAGMAIANPLPPSWLGRADVPPTPPTWASLDQLSVTHIRNLQAQIAYDQSGWNYGLVGTDNQLGRYQFSPALLETYGLLAAGSTAAYGIDSVNYRNCWNPLVYNKGVNAYQNYFYNITSLHSFLSTTIAQEHLSYQYLVDLYLISKNVGAILSTDSADTAAGMIYVAWTLGVGSAPTDANPAGTGAWAWRFNVVGAGANSFNSGRYAVDILSA